MNSGPLCFLSSHHILSTTTHDHTPHSLLLTEQEADAFNISEMTLDPRLRGDPPRDPRRRESPSSSSTLSSSTSSKRSRTLSDVGGPAQKALTATGGGKSHHDEKSGNVDYPLVPKNPRHLASPDSKPPPSRPSVRNSPAFQQASNIIAGRASRPSSPSVSIQSDVWTPADKEASQSGQTGLSIKNCYYDHLVKRSSGDKRSEGREEQPQQWASPSAGSKAAFDQNPAAPSAPSPISSSATPSSGTPQGPIPPQAVKRTIIPGKTWTNDEETHLLRIALQHQSEVNVLTQVSAVFKDFRSIFPKTTRSSEAVHVKYRQLLQAVPKKEDEGEEGEILEGKSEEEGELGEAEGDEDGREHEEVEDNNEVGGDFTRAEKAAGCAEAPQGAHALVSEKQRQGDDKSQSSLDTTPSAELGSAAQPQVEQAPSASIQPTRSPQAPEGTPPAQPQGNNAVQPILPVLPAIDFDFDVDHLTYGLRFSRLPRNCELSIFSPTRYKLRSLTSDQQPPLGAAFVFQILGNGATQGLVLPPGTKTQVVVVPAAEDEGVGGTGGEEEGRGGGSGAVAGRYVAETHFESPADKFLVVFASPL